MTSGSEVISRKKVNTPWSIYRDFTVHINSNINCVLISVFSYLFKNKTIEDKSESEAL